MGLNLIRLKKWQNIDNKGKFSCSYADDGSSSAFTLHLSNRMCARYVQVEMHNRHTAIAKQSLSLAVCICYYDYIFVSCYSVFHLHFFCHSTANVRSFGVERFCLADSCSGFSVLAMFGRYLQHVFLYVISQSFLSVSISVCAVFFLQSIFSSSCVKHIQLSIQLLVSVPVLLWIKVKIL